MSINLLYIKQQVFFHPFPFNYRQECAYYIYAGLSLKIEVEGGNEKVEGGLGVLLIAKSEAKRS